MVKLTLPFLLLATSALANVQTTAAEKATVAKVRPSIASLADGGRFLGSAVLIGEDGRFIAHRSILRDLRPGEGIIATMPDGQKVRLFVDTEDLPTSYVLLQAKPWAGGITPVKSLAGDPKEGTSLVAILGDHVFQAQVSPRERIGIDRATARMVPLTELTFEGTNGIVGGSALFTPAGEFAGFVTAVLTPQQSALQRNARMVGPSNLVIGYSVAPDVTRRSVEGFLSAARRPQVAAVGVVCKDAPGGGALIESIDPTSPAARAGMMLSDIIVQIGDRPIANQIDFARTLYRLKPGTTVEFRLRRGSSQTSVQVQLTLAPTVVKPGR